MKDAECGRLSLQLTRYAFACVRHSSWHEAEDFAHEVITDLIDPKTRTWAPDTEKLFEHLAKHVRAAVSAKCKGRKRHRETPYEPDDGFDRDDAVDKPG